MRKLLYIFREMLRMIRRHRAYFLAPIFLLLALLAFLVFYIGPTVIIAFFYAGV